MELHEEILKVMRERAEGEHTYINPHFMLAVTEAISDYYEVEDDVVDEWVSGMFEV